MAILKGSNRPVLDDNGRVHAELRSALEVTKVRPETGEAYDCMEWTFVWVGSRHEEGTHHLQTGKKINPPNEEGVCNDLTNLLLRLQLVNRDELDNPEVDTDDAMGLRVTYEMMRNEKQQYIMNLDTLRLESEEEKTLTKAKK